MTSDTLSEKGILILMRITFTYLIEKQSSLTKKLMLIDSRNSTK